MQYCLCLLYSCIYIYMRLLDINPGWCPWSVTVAQKPLRLANIHIYTTVFYTVFLVQQTKKTVLVSGELQALTMFTLRHITDSARCSQQVMWLTQRRSAQRRATWRVRCWVQTLLSSEFLNIRPFVCPLSSSWHELMMFSVLCCQHVAPSVSAAAHSSPFLPARQHLQSVWEPGGLRSPWPIDLLTRPDQTITDPPTCFHLDL